MLNNKHFYNRTIRKIVVAFGTLFNDLYLVRYTKTGTEKEKIKVPLNYGPKEKYIVRINSDPTLTKSIAVAVPRMSFELTNISYDASRKQQSTLQNFAIATGGGVNKQYAPIPYNYEFSLSIYVRNTEDGTQILEQILPFFTPDFTVSVNFIREMGRTHDLPIILNDVSSEIDHEGDFTNTRLIIWTLTFTAKSFIFPAVRVANTGIIHKANTNMHIDLSTPTLQKVGLNTANGSGYLIPGEVFRVKNKGLIGTVDYFNYKSPTSVLVATDLNMLLTIGDIVRGDSSNSYYPVVSLDQNAMKVVVIKTEPNPNTASPDDEFGFAETITEFPNTL